MSKNEKKKKDADESEFAGITKTVKTIVQGKGATRVSFVKFKKKAGKGYDEFADVRKFYLDKDGELKGTSKGIMVGLDQVPDIIKGLKKLLAKYAPTE